jgi:hypothetical protein
LKHFENFYGEKKKVELPDAEEEKSFSFVEYEKSLPPKDYTAIVRKHKEILKFCLKKKKKKKKKVVECPPPPPPEPLVRSKWRKKKILTNVFAV